MKVKSSVLLVFSVLSFHVLIAQTGPWARYNGKMKGEALIRDSDGGYLKEVQSIVEGGGDVNWQMEGSGNTPLMAAATAGHLDIVKFLISKGADPGLKDNNGRTAADRARLAGANDVVKYLNGLSAGSSAAVVQEVGQSANTIRKKEPSGPWAKYNGKMKGEALIRDADGGYLKDVQSIVEGGGDVNWQMEGSGNTPLMAAATAGHLDIVKFLIANGADPQMRDSRGKTAADKAQKAGANDVARYLKSQLSTDPVNQPAATEPPVQATPPARPAQPARPVRPNQPARPARPAPASPSPSKASSTSWAPFGTYKVGDKVRFFAGSWKTGTVKEVGIAGDYSKKIAAPTERKYLISREGAYNWNDWTDWGNVTGMEREDYWTGYFIGDWRLGETMAANTRIEGSQQRDEYSFHSASEALNIQPNGTYQWKTIDKKLITGNWKPADDGAGIVLLKAYQSINWTLRNETNATEENIRGLQSARLTADGKMSIVAQRLLK